MAPADPEIPKRGGGHFFAILLLGFTMAGPFSGSAWVGALHLEPAWLQDGVLGTPSN